MDLEAEEYKIYNENDPLRCSNTKKYLGETAEDEILDPKLRIHGVEGLSMRKLTYDVFPPNYWQGDLSWNGTLTVDDFLNTRVLPMIRGRSERLLEPFRARIDHILKNQEMYKVPFDKPKKLANDEYRSAQEIIKKSNIFDLFPTKWGHRMLKHCLRVDCLLMFTDPTTYARLGKMSQQELRDLLIEKAQDGFFNQSATEGMNLEFYDELDLLEQINTL